MGGLFQLFWGRGRDFQELGPCPLFDLLWLAWELSWHWWVCHFNANVLQWAYNEAQGPLEVSLPPSWTQLVLTSLCHVLWLYHSFKGLALPHSLPFQYLCRGTKFATPKCLFGMQIISSWEESRPKRLRKICRSYKAIVRSLYFILNVNYLHKSFAHILIGVVIFLNWFFKILVVLGILTSMCMCCRYFPVFHLSFNFVSSVLKNPFPFLFYFAF